MPSPPARPSRRAFVAGLASAAGLTLVGCDDDGTLANLPGLPERTPEPDPDRSVVRRAREAETRLEDLVSQTRRRHPELRDRLRSALDGHREHASKLLYESQRHGTHVEVRLVPEVAKNPVRALADVVVAESQLARKHARLALKAQSGPVARVVASMSAAAAQQASVLGTGAKR